MGDLRRLSPSGLAFIRSWEDFRPAPYRDAGGRLTIGYGHLIRPGEHFSEITLAEAEHLLSEDVLAVELGLSGLCHDVELVLREFDALCSFAFNIGLGAFYHSTLCRLLKAGDKTRAADEFPRWCHVAGREVAGLRARREAERRVFLGLPEPRYPFPAPAAPAAEESI